MRRWTEPSAEQAWKGFLLALVVGLVALIAFPVASVVAVAFYGLWLWHAQNSRHVYLSPPVKDSPYFLGFLLTLGGLVAAFAGMAANPDEVRTDPTEVAFTLALALVATGAGLVCRQALLTTDPTDSIRDNQAQSLMDQLREQATQVYAVQADTLALLTEFLETRTSLFREEEAATRAYTSRLAQGAQIFGDLVHGYPERVSEVLGSLEASHAETVNHLKAHQTNIAAFEEALAGGIKRDHERYAAAVDNLLESVEAAHGRLLESLPRTIDTANATAAGIQSAVAPVAGGIGHLSAAARTLAEVIEGLNQTAQDLRLTIGDLSAQAASAAGEMAKLPIAAGAAAGHLEEAMRALHGRVMALAQDITAIDSTVDEVVRLLDERLKQLAVEK